MGLLSGLGRPAELIEYSFKEYEGKEYCVTTILHKGSPVKVVIDKEDYELVCQYSWHVSAGNYVSSTFLHDGMRKALYLHNLVMNRDSFKGKGQSESIDHINRNGFDNRKENLRLVSQTAQNVNQNSRQRKVELPVGFPITPDDIPRHIWYVRANGLHGDRFAIEFKTENIVWKTTSSKSVPIQAKLAQANEKLAEFYSQYPYLNPATIEEERAALLQSFEAILAL